MSNPTAPTELLVLDIDGLHALPTTDIKDMAQRIVLQLPSIF